MKFLIVDDNKIFSTYLREFITKESDQCIELEDGQNVNSVYNEFKPDWVVLDIMMKNANGFKVAEKLKEEFPNARFVIVSDYPDAMFRKKAEELGAAAFISKEDLFELNKIIYGK